MNITVWSNFSKRENSTKQPGGGQQIDVKLKDNCSIENPIFLLASGGGMPDYTYAAAFGQYYYVTDIISVNSSMAEIHCKHDAMATHKGDIGATDAFILYDTTLNKYIPDTRLPCFSDPMIAASGGVALDHFSQSGTIIVTCTNEDGCGSYAIPPARLADLIPNDFQDQMDASVETFIDTQWAGIESVISSKFVTGADVNFPFLAGTFAGLRELFVSGKAIDNIKDVRWIPFNVIDLDPSDWENIFLGKYDTHVSGQRLSQGATRILTGSTGSVSIPWRFDDWRNSEPYTQVYVSIPFVGTINIPASTFLTKGTLRLDYSIDKISGDIAYQLWAGNADFMIGTYGASTGISVAMGTTARDPLKVVSNLTEASTSVLIGNYPGAMGQAVNAFVPTPQTVGGLGSSAGMGLVQEFNIWTVVHAPAAVPDSVQAVMGTPAFQMKRIGNLSGYVQCQNASVSGNMRSEDRNTINGYLNSGFFYE